MGIRAIVKLILEHGVPTHGHRKFEEWAPVYWARMRGFYTDIEGFTWPIDKYKRRPR